MLLSLIKYFQGYVYVQLTGYAPERFLNLCGSHDILIWNLTPCEDGEGYRFCISVRGFFRLKPILKKTRTHIRILKRTGAPFAAFRYRRRRVFAAGIFLFAGLIWYLSGFVWNIEINGNSYLSDEMILDFLEEEHCTFGTRKRLINCEELEEALRSRYGDVIWTSIKLYGTKMTVDVQENLLPAEEYEAKPDLICDIVSSKDGVITDIITRSGTPLVAAGSEVKAGDVLVSGRIEVTDDNGEVSQYLYHSSDADIYARVVYPYEDVIEADYTDVVQTGETKEDYSVMAGDNLLKNPFFRNPFTEYQVTSDTWQLHLSEHFYLPVWFTRHHYEEVTKTPKTHSEEEIQQIATKNLQNYLEDLEEKGIQILEKNVMIEKMDGTYVARGTIVVRESVVSYQPTEQTDTGETGQSTDESE